ncbi:MAG: hypothetical protein KC455_10995 [Carnobacterium sp.]|nr:hypothetical protein [Carnobacterium sp.]
MFNPDEKLKVFISSKVGDTDVDLKYNLARKAIKEMLNSTGLFNVYLFEDSGAASLSAKNHYKKNLISSDICLFLIDNLDGVPEGVQVEIDEANKHKIPALYYFCDKGSKDKTPTQISLLTADSPKQRTINSFEEFIESGAKDVINDILLIYREYSSNGMSLQNEPSSFDDSKQNIDGDSLQAGDILNSQYSHFDKTLLKNDLCKQYLASLIFNTDKAMEEEKNNLDYYCSLFLPILFENKNIEGFNFSLFLEELKKSLPPTYFNIVSIRWTAIREHYHGNIDKSISKLTEAYNLSQENNIDQWFVQDILIDLRNEIILKHQIRNEISNKNFGQEELNKKQEKLYYPVVDRNEKNFLEWIEKERQKEEIRSSNSHHFYGDLTSLSDNIANIFFQSMIFGSFTHLTRIYSHIQKLTYQLCSFTDNWPWFMSTLKNSIMELDIKKVPQITEHFELLLEKMNSEDALEIYDYSSNYPLDYHKFKANLLAMSEIGYYLSKEDFEIKWKNLKIRIDDWLDETNSSVNLMFPIFNCLNKISERLPNSYLINLSLNILSSEKKRYHESAMKLMIKSIDFSSTSEEENKRVITMLINLIKRKDAIMDNSNYIEQLCFSLGLTDTPCKDELEIVLKKEWPIFYENEYLVETTKENYVNEMFLQKQITIIKSRNKEQGKDGKYSFYSNSPLFSSKFVISNSDEAIDQTILDELLCATTQTILSTQQLVEEKFNAYQLLIQLYQYDDSIFERNSSEVEKIFKLSDTTESYDHITSNINKNLITFAHNLLSVCLGNDKYYEILSELSTYNDDNSKIAACKLIENFSNNNYHSEIPSEIETLLFQYCLIWNNTSSFQVRRHTIKILILFLKFNKFVPLINQQFINLMTNDNAYIKSYLAHSAKKIEYYDKKTGDFILNTALKDNNYVIRKIAKIQQNNN